MKKSAILACCAALALALQARAEEGLVKVGGHMKGPVLSDNVWGTAMVNGVKESGSYSAGSYFSTHAFQLYVSKDITENVAVYAAPEFNASGAGATPSLGKKMGEGLKDTAAAAAVKLYQLYVGYNIPSLGVQMRAGYLNLPFTQDYGKELFWHEQHNGGKFTLASAWHDTGLELYKAFELGSFSLPVSAYIVNGNGSYNRDNNNSRAVMVHAEPEFGALKTFASFGAGKWGDAVVLATGTMSTSLVDDADKKTFYRASVGASYKYKRLALRAETGWGRWNDYIYSGKDYSRNRDDFGYYGKLFYTVVPEKLTAMVHYDYYVNDVAAETANVTYAAKEKYDTTYFGLQYEMAPAATFLVGWTVGNWRNTDIPTKRDFVKFDRFQTSVRVTF